MTTKVLLDLDTGIDDALAICYVLGSPHLELVGITATFGNVSQAQSTANALAILHLLGHDDIPVYPGAPQPLCWSQCAPYEPSTPTRAIHGPSGLGKLKLPPSPRPAEKRRAPEALNSLCQSLGHKLAVVATGPLTNLALALDQNPDALSCAGSLSVMGGAFMAPGNVTPYGEFNIINDPEAAFQVLSGKGITSWNQRHTKTQAPKMLGLDVTMQTILTRHQTSHWRQLNEAGQLLASMTDFYIDAYQRNNPAMDGCALHDPLAAASIDHPELVDGPFAPVLVTLEGPERARTLIEPTIQSEFPADKCLQVALEVDSEAASKTIVEAIERCLELSR